MATLVVRPRHSIASFVLILHLSLILFLLRTTKFISYILGTYNRYTELHLHL